MLQGKTWLLSSAGRRGALVSILRRAGQMRNKVIAIDISRLSAAGHLADHFELVPRVDSDEFVPRVIEICEKYGVNLIVPTIDPEIYVYARNRQLFESVGATPLVSAPHVTLLGWDKWKFSQWLSANNFPGPKTVEITDTNGLSKLHGEVIAKPRNGSSSIGIAYAKSVSDLPPNLGAEYIVQEQAKGIEVTVDFAVARDGSFLGAVPRRRLETRAGEVSKGVTIQIPGLAETMERVVEALDGAYGVLNLQLFVDPQTGDFSIIELNPRFGGGYPLSDAAGADFAGAFLTGSTETITWKPGAVMLRYDEAVHFHDDAYVEDPWKKS